MIFSPKYGFRVFFCVGSAKSGTTLLARVLDQHPKIACIWESYALHPRSASSIFNPQSINWKTHGFSEDKVIKWAKVWRAQPYLLFRRFLRKLTGKTYFATNQFRITMTEALEDFGQRCDAVAVGDKWPWYVEYLSILLKAFPQAKYIYIVRDPRGLWNSAQRFKNRNRGDELLARLLKYDQIIAPFLGDPRFITVRYQDLVFDPSKTIKKLYNFLEFDFSEDYLFYEARNDPYPNRWGWIPETGQQFNPWHVIKWREQMSLAEIDAVTKRAKFFIDKYDFSE